MSFDLNLFKKSNHRYAIEYLVYKYLFWIVKYGYLIMITANTNMLLANKDLTLIW